MRNRVALQHYALLIRNGNPEAWELFLREFEIARDEITVAVIAAEQNNVLVSQGRAQQMHELLQIFKDCNLPNQKPLPRSAVSAPEKNNGYH